MTQGHQVEVIVASALIEKVQLVEARLADLQARLKRAREEAIGPALANLRMLGCVLLYVGNEQDPPALAEKIQHHLGPASQDALAHLFDLNNAPLDEAHRQALRAAFNHGLNRW